MSEAIEKIKEAKKILSTGYGVYVKGEAITFLDEALAELQKPVEACRITEDLRRIMGEWKTANNIPVEYIYAPILQICDSLDAALSANADLLKQKPVCKTCGGSGMKYDHIKAAQQADPYIPCPSCQKPEAELEKEINKFLDDSRFTLVAANEVSFLKLARIWLYKALNKLDSQAEQIKTLREKLATRTDKQGVNWIATKEHCARIGNYCLFINIENGDKDFFLFTDVEFLHWPDLESKFTHFVETGELPKERNNYGKEKN
jgi:hypothetical protein